MNGMLLPPILGVLGLLAAYYLYRLIKSHPPGDENVKKIGDQIHEGAMVFMRREYSILVIFLAIQVVLTFVFLDSNVGIAVIVAFRLAAVKWNWSFPAIREPRNPT